MESNSNWYMIYQKNPHAKIRLFCFHHSGGGASSYFSWVSHLSSKIEMVAIQLPGRENRFNEPLNSNIYEIVDCLGEDFFCYKDKPFFVFGHSLGALLGFEFIKSIINKYLIYPEIFIVSAAKPPHLPSNAKTFADLDDISLKEKIKIYNGIDANILNNKDLLEIFLPIIKNDFNIYKNYNFLFSKQLPCDILAFLGDQDHTISREESIQWAKYTTGKFQLLSFPGNHFFIKENQSLILNIINKVAESYI